MLRKKTNFFLEWQSQYLPINCPKMISFFCVAVLDKTRSHFTVHNNAAPGQQQQTWNNQITRPFAEKKTWSPLPMYRSWFLSFPWAGKHLRNTSQYTLPHTIFWHRVLNRTSFLFTFIFSTQHVWNTRQQLIVPSETIPSTLSAILRYIYYFSGPFNRKRHYW